jgi:archaellum component FlaC
MEGVEKMNEPLRRLTLRLTPSNPIFTYPHGERNKKAEELLRIGSEFQRLEKAINKLENLLGQISNGQITYKEQDPEQVNKKDLKNSLNLIHAILAEAEQE